MHMVAILLMILSTFAFISAFATTRKREQLIPARVKRADPRRL